MKWLLVFPVSDLLRAISVIKEKKNKQRSLAMIEGNYGEVCAEGGASFVRFSHTTRVRKLKVNSLLRCARIAYFGGLFAGVFVKVPYDSAHLLRECGQKHFL